jgi:hypothetical protein
MSTLAAVNFGFALANALCALAPGLVSERQRVASIVMASFCCFVGLVVA